MLRARALPLALLAAFVAAFALPSGALAGAAGGGAPSAKQTTRNLARALHKAKSQGAKRDAITAIAETLHLGIRKASNFKPIVQGSSIDPRGVYLYDFEVSGLAQALGRGQKLSFDDLAASITAKFPTPLTGAQLLSASQAGIAAARAGSTKGDKALVPLLADAIAKEDGVDLMTVGPGDAKLNPILGVLAAADVAMPLAKRLPAKKAALASAARVNPCTAPSGRAQSGIFVGKWIVGLTPAAQALLLVNFITDMFHGTAMAYSIKVSDGSDKTKNFTAFGNSSLPRSGEPAELVMQADMLDQYSQAAIRCGAMLGYTIPDKGPIGGVRVDWELGSGREPSELGIVDCPTVGCTATTSDGKATWKLVPDDELLPNQGAKISQTIVMTARATYQFTLGNLAGAVIDTIGINKFVSIGTTVDWHQPQGYHFELSPMTFSNTQPDGHKADEKITLHGIDQCTGPLAQAHPTYPTLGIGLVPGTIGQAAGSGYFADRVDHNPDHDDDSSSEGRPMIFPVPSIPAGPMARNVYARTITDWAAPTLIEGGATVEADWGKEGSTPKVDFRFKVPGASPGEYGSTITPTNSDLCKIARPFIGS